jgi:hypothetical protein
MPVTLSGVSVKDEVKRRRKKNIEKHVSKSE